MSLETAGTFPYQHTVHLLVPVLPLLPASVVRHAVVRPPACTSAEARLTETRASAGGRVFRKIVLCLGMELAAMMGALLRPEDVEDLLRNGQRVRIESICREEDRDGSDGH